MRERRQIAGVAALRAALLRAEPLRHLVVRQQAGGPELAALLADAEARGLPVQRVGPRHFERLLPHGGSADVLGMLGPPPDADPRAVLESGGAVWLLAGVAYPGNAGFAIRTAEVSGAAGVFLDTDFDHEARRDALRASMRADRFLPVHWEPAEGVLDAAGAAGRMRVAIEDVGERAPWEVDLAGPVLLVVGGEARGIRPELLARCDEVVRLPMAGFIRSYNLQAAVAAVASERFRQLAQAGA